MNIELMTGSNQQMVHLRTVGTVDGTSTTNNTYSYPCLAVDPNSQIYFYQFTSPSSSAVLWTTRFTIADATGNTVPPTLQETTATGEIVRYGIGKLQDQSLVDAPPARGTNAPSSGNATTTSSNISTAPPNPNGVATRSVTLPSAVSTNDGSGNDNSNTQSAALNSSAPKPSQSQKGSALSYKHTTGFGFLATAILCGSMLL
jgi:hypothetical protein